MIKDALEYLASLARQSDRIRSHHTIAGDEIIVYPDGKYETVSLPKHGRDDMLTTLETLYAWVEHYTEFDTIEVFVSQQYIDVLSIEQPQRFPIALG